MTTQSNPHPTILTTERRRPCKSRPSDCMRRYNRPPPPPHGSGLTPRQSGELARIGEKYGALRWRLRDDGTVAVAVFGDRPQRGEEVLLMVMRADGTLQYLRIWTQAITKDSDHDG